MSTALVYDLKGLADLEQRIRNIGNLKKRALLNDIGAVVTSQTQIRIESEKTSPDGQPWDPWSGKYAETRDGNQSLLMSEGHLVGSIQYIGSSNDVAIGSNLVYAATQDLGDEKRGIPARQYLGLSRENKRELIDVIDDFIDQAIGF